jgi:hypothetical protein
VNDSILVNEWIKQDGMELWTLYTNKGKFKYQVTNKYNTQGVYLETESTGKRHKPLTRSGSSINDNNTVASCVQYYKGKLNVSVNYTYIRY